MQESNEHTEVLRNIPLIPLRDLVVFPATLVPVSYTHLTLPTKRIV